MAKNTSLTTSLSEAVKEENIELVRVLLTKNTNVNETDSNGNTPLHQATFNENYEIVKILLKAGAEVNQKNKDGHTALHFVGKAQIMELIEEFPRIRQLLKEGTTHKCYNAPNAKVSLSLAELLLSNKADANTKDNIGNTPFHYAPPSIELINTFASFNANFNIKNCYNSTILHELGWIINLEMLKCFIKNGSDINALDSDGRTLLMKLLGKPGDDEPVYPIGSELIPYLIEHSDLNVIDKAGNHILLVQSDQEDWQPSIVEEIAKLRILNIPIHQSILDYILHSHHLNNYFDWCIRELNQLKSLKFHDSWVSYFDLLTDHRYKLIKYAGNENLVRDFEKNNRRHDLRIYGCKIRRNFFKAIKKRKVRDRRAVILSDCLPVFHLKHLLVEKILDLLKEEDLVKLC